MAKFVFVAVLLVAAVGVSMAAPIEEALEFAQGAEAFEGPEYEEAGEHLRFRRVTCDLLSFGGVVGDSACAANCLSMGKAGGSCNGGVCECRTTTFRDLWDQRFG